MNWQRRWTRQAGTGQSRAVIAAISATVARGPLLRHLDVGLSNHFAPFLGVGSDPCAKLLRIARYRVEAERRQALLNVRQRHDLDDLAVEQGGDLLGRSAWNRDGKPRFALHLG